MPNFTTSLDQYLPQVESLVWTLPLFFPSHNGPGLPRPEQTQRCHLVDYGKNARWEAAVLFWLKKIDQTSMGISGPEYMVGTSNLGSENGHWKHPSCKENIGRNLILDSSSIWDLAYEVVRLVTFKSARIGWVLSLHQHFIVCAIKLFGTYDDRRFFRSQHLVGGDWNIFDFPFHIWDVIPTPLTNSIIFQRGGQKPPETVHSPKYCTFLGGPILQNAVLWAWNFGQKYPHDPRAEDFSLSPNSRVLAPVDHNRPRHT